MTLQPKLPPRRPALPDPRAAAHLSALAGARQNANPASASPPPAPPAGVPRPSATGDPKPSSSMPGAGGALPRLRPVGGRGLKGPAQQGGVAGVPGVGADLSGRRSGRLGAPRSLRWQWPRVWQRDLRGTRCGGKPRCPGCRTHSQRFRATARHLPRPRPPLPAHLSRGQIAARARPRWAPPRRWVGAAGAGAPGASPSRACGPAGPHRAAAALTRHRRRSPRPAPPRPAAAGAAAPQPPPWGCSARAART
jgi:hypothetical protein